MSPHKGYMNIAIATMLFVAAFAGVALIADEDVSAADGDAASSVAVKTITYEVDGDSATRKLAADATTFIAPSLADLGLSSEKEFIQWKLNESAVFKAGQEYLVSALGFTEDVSNVTLTAEFDENIYITFNVGEQSFKCIVKDGALNTTSDAYKGLVASVKAIDQTKFEIGKLMNGESEAGSITLGEDGAVTVSVTNLTGSAVLTLELTPIYKVSFVVDGVTIKSTTTQGGVEIPEKPEKANYKFVGWYDSTETKYDESYVFTADTILSAVFEPNTYTVHFVVDGKAFAERSSKYGYQIDLPALPDGYKAWVGADGKVVSSPVTIIGETTFTAVADVFYTITFVNGEEVIGTAKVLENTVIAPEQVPAVPEGCSGWDFDASVAVSADATVKAIPYVYYTVVFDFGDKNFDNVSVQVISGQTVPADKVPAIPENFPKADQTWNFDIEAPVVKDMTVTLRDNIYYTVTFIAGEQTVDTVSVLEKTVVAAPELPEGYKAWDFDFTAVITADTTIRAIAKENVFDVTFEIEGKTPVVQKSDSLVIPDPNVADKVFKGWVVKGQTQYVDPSTYAIKEDVTFVAIYDEAPAPAGPGFFETNEGKCVAVIIGVALLAFVYAVYTNMFGMKDFLTSIKIQRVKKE